MARLPMMEIHAEASYVLPPNILACVHKAKELFGFVTTEELRVQKLGYPIHLMSIGEIKRDLDILVGVFDHDDAIIVDVRILPFAFEEDGATGLHFGCSKLGRLKKCNCIGEGEGRRG